MSVPIADLDGAAFAAAVRRVAAQASQSNADGPLHNAIHISAVPDGLQLVAAHRYGCAVETVPATVHDAEWSATVTADRLLAAVRGIGGWRSLKECGGGIWIPGWNGVEEVTYLDVRYPLAGVLMNLPTEPCTLLDGLPVRALRDAAVAVVRAARKADTTVDLVRAAEADGPLLEMRRWDGLTAAVAQCRILHPDRLPRVDARLLRRMADSLPIRAALALAQQGPATALLWTCDAAPAYRCLIMPVTTYAVAAKAGRLGKAVGG